MFVNLINIANIEENGIKQNFLEYFFSFFFIHFNSNPMNDFGSFLKGRLAELAMTQADFAKSLNKSPGMVSGWINDGIVPRIPTIKAIAIPYWRQAIAGASKTDYVFSVGLKPGPKQIRPEQLTRRWEQHVKMKLGITADLYSLKHLNTTEVVDALDEQAAADLNSHSSTAMVVSVYDTKNKPRKDARIRKVGNAL